MKFFFDGIAVKFYLENSQDIACIKSNFCAAKMYFPSKACAFMQKKPIDSHRCWLLTHTDALENYFFIRLRLISKCYRCFCLLKEISPWKDLVRLLHIKFKKKKQSRHPKKSKSLSNMAKWISLSLTSISIKCMINQ